MDDYSPAMDSQAAYAAMPNQGLPTTSGQTAGATPQQKQLQQLAAQLLMKGFSSPAPQMNGMPPQAIAAQPTVTPGAGQWIGGR